MNRFFACFGLALSLSGYAILGHGAAPPPVFKPAWETPTALKNPESVLYDEKRNTLYVSNIDGDPQGADNQGFISKVSLDGAVTQLVWVGGLNAPKGMAMVGDKLYVSDINQLVEIAIDQGTVTQRYPATGAQFLNDVAADGAGLVYVSDMFTDTIYRLENGVLSEWLKSPELESPNGLLVQGDKLIVGGWGVRTNGFETKTRGKLKSVSLNDKSIQPLGNGSPVGNLDGVEPDGKGDYFATDWMAGRLLWIKASGDPKLLLTLAAGSADLAYLPKEGLAIIPMMKQNKLVAYKRPVPKPAQDSAAPSSAQPETPAPETKPEPSVPPAAEPATQGLKIETLPPEPASKP